MTGLSLPTCLALLGFVTTLGAAFVGGWFMLRGKKVDGPQAAITALLAQAPALLNTNLASLARITELTQTINEYLNAIEKLKDEIKTKDDEGRTLTAMRDLALQAQEKAEGRLEGYIAGNKSAADDGPAADDRPNFTERQ